MNNDYLSPDLCGLIRVLANLLVREVENEMMETSEETQSESKDADRAFVEQMESQTDT